MAKALLGYMSSTDPRIATQLAGENRRLRQRVADLEAQILRLQSENDSLAAAAHDASVAALEHDMGSMLPV
jgi:cell division protein FtsB